MTELLERAVEALRELPAPAQDHMAQAILALTTSGRAPSVDPEHLPFVLEGLAQIERGDLATDEEVEEAFRTFGR